MTVVINDFEVVTEPAATAPRGAQAPAAAAKELPDVERVMAVCKARDQRVRAY
jgi:hypothetical protein